MSNPNKPRKATVVSVAQRAGVSPSAVSFVMNGRDRELGISAETRRKVLEAAQVLNYMPDRSARSLRGKGTQTLGVLWSFGGPFRTDRLIRHFTDKSLAADYVTHIFDSLSDPDIILRVLTELAGRKIDGVILQISSRDTLEHPGIREILLSFRSAVIVGYNLEPVWKDQVNQDRESAFAESVEYMVKHGRRKLAVLTSAKANTRKLETIRATWRRLGLPEEDITVLDLDAPNAEEGLKRVATVLDSVAWGGAEGSDSLISSLDEYAFVAIGHLQQRGIRVPDDVAVVGFNNSLMAPYSTPPLASIERRDVEAADKAMDMLFARLADTDLPPQAALVTAGFVPRESAGGF